MGRGLSFHAKVENHVLLTGDRLAATLSSADLYMRAEARNLSVTMQAHSVLHHQKS